MGLPLSTALPTALEHTVLLVFRPSLGCAVDAIGIFLFFLGSRYPSLVQKVLARSG